MSTPNRITDLMLHPENEWDAIANETPDSGALQLVDEREAYFLASPETPGDWICRA